MYKVFYNNSVIIIGEELTKDKKNRQLHKVSDKKETFRFLRAFLSTENPVDIHLFGYDEQDLFGDLKIYFQYVEAAGGLVKNNLQEYLFIKRFNIWDLPKGKMKKNESPELAAIREVEEETGAGEIEIAGNLPPTYHIYPYKNNFVLKKTYWYLMLSGGKGELIPQQEEDITEAVWLNKSESRIAIQSSYRSLKENFLNFFEE